MSNFVSTFKAGQEGRNFGITTGIPALDEAINGLQRGVSIGLAAAEKVGKTTLADFSFLISPYLYMLSVNRLDDIEWIYYSFEIDRVSKEFKIASFFMAHDFKEYNFIYKDKVYQMNPNYLMGKQIHRNSDDTTEIVPVSVEHEIMLKQVYINRIIPMFGRYDEHGNKIAKGKIDFIEMPENPTGVYKYLELHAKLNGEVLYETYTSLNEKNISEIRKRIIGYKPNNPNKFTVVIADHIRKFRRERGFTMKDNIDKWLEYTTELRNRCKFTFINIAHMNRGLSNIERLKFAGEYVFPTSDDVKDSGNLGEESTYVLTMFNPNDEKYNITKHFGVDVRSYPNYRSLHLVASRDTDFPAHIQLNMYGGINTFGKLNI